MGLNDVTLRRCGRAAGAVLCKNLREARRQLMAAGESPKSSGAVLRAEAKARAQDPTESCRRGSTPSTRSTGAGWAGRRGRWPARCACSAPPTYSASFAHVCLKNQKRQLGARAHSIRATRLSARQSCLNLLPYVGPGWYPKFRWHIVLGISAGAHGQA